MVQRARRLHVQEDVWHGHDGHASPDHPRGAGSIPGGRSSCTTSPTDPRGWLHTHGLAAHGKPELEIRNVPLFLGRLAAGLLNDLADHLLNDATTPLLAGQNIAFGSSSIHVVEGHPDPDAGYDPEHYRDLQLVLVDPTDAPCACEECAKELARRPRVPS